MESVFGCVGLNWMRWRLKILKSVLTWLVVSSGYGAQGQATPAQVRKSIDSLLSSPPTINASSLRNSLHKLVDWVEANTPESPEKYGAKGDGITDDRAAFEAWVAANPSGTLRIPAKTYKINGTFTISSGSSGNSKLHIDATGATLITENTPTTPILRITQSKYLTITGLTIDGLVDFDGMWYSDFQNCKFLKSVKFGFTNAATFDEFYWNTWTSCDFNEIWIHTGTAADLREFNANAFYRCNIWKGDYAIRVFGNQLLQGFYFYNCDISYQKNSLLYVNESLVDGSLFFFGGYWDSEKGMPINTKGIVINAQGVITPNSANASSFTLQTGSKQTSDVYSGARNGSRLAASAVNLFKNGDLQFGTNTISNAGLTMTLRQGTGMFGRYLHCEASELRHIDFESIAAPFSGTYSVTVIGRNNTKSVLVPVLVKNNKEVLYTPVHLRDASIADESFVVSSANVELAQGEILKLRFYTQDKVLNSFDIAYCGLTYGKMGMLYAPLHPLARTASDQDVSGIGLKTTYAQVEILNVPTSLFKLKMSNYSRISAELTCFGEGQTYPDGATFSKHIITANRHEGAITFSLLPVVASAKAGAIATAPIITLEDNGGGSLEIKATATDRNVRFKCKLEGSY